MSIPESFLLELKLKYEIEDVISSHVALKRRGGSLVGLCPFHSEKTASFTVFPDTQSYYCFGCGAGGDVITFTRSVENLDYLDAVSLLAERIGMELPDRERYEGPDRKRILEINTAAARYFRDCLFNEKGSAALIYLEGRKLSKKTTRKFGFGYAPDGWDNLLKHLSSKGFTREEIKASGLCVRGKNGSYYDYFRNRLIIPIFDVRGNVIAFGGRVMDGSQPKYLNSPDTAVFKKSAGLFNLNFAKTSGNNYLILAEGYLDVISLCQAGFLNSVATLGTAITDEQARLLKRYAGDAGVIIAYDSDEAGGKATLKAISKLEAVGVRVRVLQLGDCKDPDEFINKHGAVRLAKLIEGSGNQIEYKLSSALLKNDILSEAGKVSYIKEAVEILSQVRSATTREVYAGKLATELSISKDGILSEIERSRKAYTRKRKAAELTSEMSSMYSKRDRINPQKADKLKAARAEEGIISIVFFNPDLLPFLEEQLKPEDFATAFNRKIYSQIKAIIDSGGVPDTVILGESFSNDEMGRLIAILNNRDVLQSEEEMKKAIFDYTECILAEKAALAPKSAAQLSAGQLEDYIKKGFAHKKRGKVKE